MNKKSSNFLVQGSILAIAGIGVRLIGMVYRMIISRLVGPEGMTYYDVAYNIYDLALIASVYSIPVAVSKLVSAKDSINHYRDSQRIFRVSFAVSTGIGLIVSSIVFIFSEELAAFMNYPSAALPLRVLAPTIFIFSAMGVLRGFFQGKRTMVPTSISQIIEQVFNALFSVGTAYLLIKNYGKTDKLTAIYGATGSTVGTVCGAMAGLIFMAFIFRLNTPYFEKKVLSDKSEEVTPYKELVLLVLRTLLPIVISMTLYQITGLIDMKMFASIMENSKGVDESTRAIIYEAYNNKYKWLYSLPVSIASAFGVSIVPALSNSYSKGDHETVRKNIASSVKLNMIIAIPAAVGLSVLAKPIILLLIGNKGMVDLGANLMTLGGIAVVLFALSTFTNGVLQGIDHINLPMIHSLISLGVHIPLVYLLVDVLDLGAYGMVIGNVSYALLICILNWFSIGSIMDYKQEIKRTFLIPFAAALVMGAVAWVINRLCFKLTAINSISCLLAIFIGMIVYFVLLIKFKGLDEEELSAIPKGRMLVKIAKKMRLL